MRNILYLDCIDCNLQGPETGNTTEIACQSDKGGLITTGGGFSTLYAQPEWQSYLVGQYWNYMYTHYDSFPVSGYNYYGAIYCLFACFLVFVWL